MKANPTSAAEKILADAVRAIRLIGAGSCGLDDFLDRELNFPEYRRTTADLLFHYFRRKKTVDAWYLSLVKRPPRDEVRSLLLAVLTQISFQNAIVPESAVNVAVDFSKAHGTRAEANFVNAVLRNALRSRVAWPETPEAVFPDALLKRWQTRFPCGELAAMAQLFCKNAAPFSFRARGGFEIPDEWYARAIPGFGGFRFYESAAPSTVVYSAALEEGKIYIQDSAASMAVSLLKPEALARVRKALDVCGAPGGKALLLSERLPETAELTVNDRSSKRQELTRENARRYGMNWRITAGEGQNLSGSYDLVLLDVPCSNTGVFRRRPDALWRFCNDSLQAVLKIQRELLESARRFVLPGGLLLYSTCSIEEEENAAMIREFCRRHPEWSLLEEKQLFPNPHCDGAYAALLQLKNS